MQEGANLQPFEPYAVVLRSCWRPSHPAGQSQGQEYLSACSADLSGALPVLQKLSVPGEEHVSIQETERVFTSEQEHAAHPLHLQNGSTVMLHKTMVA